MPAVSTPMCVKPAATCDETPCGLLEFAQYPTSYWRQQIISEI